MHSNASSCHDSCSAIIAFTPASRHAEITGIKSIAPAPTGVSVAPFLHSAASFRWIISTRPAYLRISAAVSTPAIAL